MTTTSGDRADLSEEPLGAVVHRLSEQVPELVRSEIRLAQAELAQKGKRAGIGVGLFSAAGLFALYGLAALVTTSIVLLDLALPLWAAALIVTGVLFAIAGVAALIGKKQVVPGDPARPREGHRRREGRRRHHQEGDVRMSTNGAGPEAIEADIARQREQLAATVDELQHRLDVPARAKDKAAQVKDRATTDTGKPRPEIAAAVFVVAAAATAFILWRRSNR